MTGLWLFLRSWLTACCAIFLRILVEGAGGRGDGGLIQVVIWKNRREVYGRRGIV